MTGKEERTKTEMKNADKQGMVRDGVSGHPGHIRIHRDLTSQTLAAVNTDNTNTFLMMRMSEDDQVQTTTTKMKIS